MQQGHLFSSTLSNLGQSQGPLLWHLAESYLNIGQKAYHVVKVEGKTIFLEENQNRPRLFSTLVKIITYLAVCPPLLALGIREYYRRSYQFEIITKETTHIALNPAQEVLTTAQETGNRPIATAYQVDSVITKLLKAKDDGLKLGIFVGRGPSQTIPQEEGWVWCSLDQEAANALSEDRLHLTMDFNDPQINRIKKIFDKVVADYSVIKFMNNPWHTLKRLLVQEPHAELITESWSGISRITMQNGANYNPREATMDIPMSDNLSYYEAEKDAFKKWVDGIGEEEGERRYQDFLDNLSKEEKEQALYMSHGNEADLRLQFMRHILEANNLKPARIDRVSQLLESIRAFLLEQFETVELKHGFYPYRKGPEAIECDYWVIKHPKTIS